MPPTTAALGTGGYAIRRDLSFLNRILFWLLLALISSTPSTSS
jgi:FtsH-binding integral membrane protein